MKTAISVPDDVFEQVNAKAEELGVSRSEFFTTAARKYLDELDEQSITNQFNEALALAGDDDSNAVAAAYGRMRIAELTEGDEWLSGAERSVGWTSAPPEAAGRLTAVPWWSSRQTPRTPVG